MIIIPGGKPKIWDKHPTADPVTAEEAYTGTFHRLCRLYAESFDADYLILSPYYGFLKPTDIVPHGYDVRFTSKGTNEQTIGLNELQEQWKKTNAQVDSITILGGKKFKPLMERITCPQQTLHFPLLNKGGIGYMQKALKEAVLKNQPIH